MYRIARRFGRAASGEGEINYIVIFAIMALVLLTGISFMARLIGASFQQIAQQDQPPSISAEESRQDVTTSRSPDASEIDPADEAHDLDPDPFAHYFIDLPNAETEAGYEVRFIARGFNRPILLRVSYSDPRPQLELSVNEGNFGIPTRLIHPGDHLHFRMTTGAEPLTLYSATLTLGAKQAKWQIVTDGESRIFVSSTRHNGNLGGLSGADALCQRLARQARLTGTFKAVLSAPYQSARARLPLAYPVKRMDGEIVAAENLWSGTLAHPVLLTELGTPTDAPWIHSNSHADGNTAFADDSAQSCHDWTDISAGNIRLWARPLATDASWIAHETGGSCDEYWPIYCVSIRPQIHAEGR